MDLVCVTGETASAGNKRTSVGYQPASKPANADNVDPHMYDITDGAAELIYCADLRRSI